MYLLKPHARCSSSHRVFPLTPPLTPHLRLHITNVRPVRHDHRLFHPTGYLNAQFKFMLKPTGDYTVHFADRESLDLASVRRLYTCLPPRQSPTDPAILQPISTSIGLMSFKCSSLPLLSFPQLLSPSKDLRPLLQMQTRYSRHAQSAFLNL